MYTLEVRDDLGNSTCHFLDSGTYSLGKALDCDIVLSDPYASRHHADVVISSSGSYIKDRNSTNGIWCNDEKIASHLVLNKDLQFRIGNHHFTARQVEDKVFSAIDSSTILIGEHGSIVSMTDDMFSTKEMLDLRKGLHELVLKYLDKYKRGVIHQLSQEDLRNEARLAAEKVIQETQLSLPDGVDVEQLLTAVVSEAIGLGALEPLLEDESITEIMVNGPDQIYVEKSGKITKTESRFNSVESLRSIIERIVTPLGRRIDEGSPMVDARLADGSRVNAIIPPLSLVGPVLTIRKFSKRKFGIEDLVEKYSLSSEMARFLEVCVQSRKNIIVSGGTGSGKTTTLNILSNFIPQDERIVTIEDAAELQLHQDHVVSLESRPANIEGKGEVAIRDLVKNALRMRPDRIVVGECRGGEALDMLQAMNTGHDGSLTTGHANSPRDFLSRLEVMVLMSGIDLPVRAIREQIASAVDIIIQQTRFSDGKRRITSIVEVDGMEGDVILLQKIFEFRQEGRDADGNILGSFRGCGYAPSFYTELEQAGTVLDRSIFGEVENR